MKFYFLLILLCSSLVQAGEVTSAGRGVPQYDVNEEAIANGPVRSMSTQNLCDGDQALSVYADRDVIARGGQAIQTCEMTLNPYFAQLLKAFIPKCAKEAALKNGMSLPTSVSIEQMGGYANRNARNSSRLSRHALGMALDISAITLHNNGMFGNSSSQRIALTENTTNQPFYDSFRSCWDAAVVQATGGKCTCSIGHSHTHEPSNGLHDDHMHISLSCPQGNAVQCSLGADVQTVVSN